MLKYAFGVGAIFAASIVSAASSDPVWPKQSYQTESFDIPFFNVSRQGEPTGPGLLFLGMVHPTKPVLNGPFLIQDSGELVWHGSSSEVAYYNVRPQVIQTSNVLTYWTGYLDPSGHGYGSVVILDDTYNIIKTICFPPSVNIAVANPNIFPGNMQDPCFVDKHESFIVTDRNSIIVTAYNATQTDLTALNGAADGWVFDCLFFELDLDTNEVLFQWSALDHIPVTKSNFVGPDPNNPLIVDGNLVGTQTAPWDFFHINSVEPIQGAYLMNSRMTWSMYKIDSTTKNIDWTLEGSHGGDFEQLDPIFFSWQHNPRVEKLTKNGMIITLFNNDNIPEIAANVNGSSGYVLELNTNAMTVSVGQDLQDETIAPIFAIAEGSVQSLPLGHHLIGYGARPFIQEWDSKANLIYSAQFARPHDTTHSYRVYRKLWQGFPTASPLVVASSLKQGQKLKIRAFMSWNGATEYTSWNLYAGDTQNDLAIVAKKVNKNGFETSIKVPDGSPSYQFVMVEALGSGGQSLANSTITAIKGATSTAAKAGATSGGSGGGSGGGLEGALGRVLSGVHSIVTGG